MAEQKADNIAETNPAPEPMWSQVWQLPVLVLGLVVFGIGVFMALPDAKHVNHVPPLLEEAALLIKARNLDEAEHVLGAELEPYIAHATEAELANYYLSWGDLVYLQQEVHHWDKAENHQLVLKYYQKAENLGLTLDDGQVQRLAETYVALRRDQEAMTVLDRLQDAPARRRYGVIKKIIVRRLATGTDAHDLATLMAQFDDELRQETNKDVRRAEEMWSVSVQAQGLLDVGEPEKSIEYLQRHMINFMADSGDDDLAPLRVLLAKAYHKLGSYAEAQRWYRLAQQKLVTDDPLNADVLVGLGQVDLAMSGDVRAALESFSVAELEYPTAGAYFEALVGRADCEARLGQRSEAIEHFGQAVKLVTEEGRVKEDKVEMLVSTIRSHVDVSDSRQDFDAALDYLSLLKPIHRGGMPAEWVLQFAVTHEKIAEQRLGRFPKAEGGEEEEGDLLRPKVESDVKRMAMQEAAIHFSKAAEFYFQHAHAMSGVQDEAIGRSLWQAAVDFDRAELWDKSIEVYAEFIKSRTGDPQYLEAINRLGLAYQASGQNEMAVDLFKQLVEGYKNTPEAYKSLVPLARCYVALGRTEDAERVLIHVVTDHPAITPDSVQYELAIMELGKLYYENKQYEPAISRLTEAVDRYGQKRQGAVLRFKLADAYRLSTGQIEQSLQEALPESSKLSMRAERTRRLEESQNLFTQVINELEAMEAVARTPVEKLYLRNAYFFRADCAYDLGRYDQAISLYDQAAKRWETHPASLVALVQIVNAYCELGKIQEAKIANDRARWQLKRIPDEAFNDSTLPMTREHWQDWLRWTSELNLFGSQANASGVEAAP